LAFSQDIVLVRWFDRTNNKSQLKIHRWGNQWSFFSKRII
jgi:hypothetical protein